MSKWDELRKILDDAEKAEGERSSPPKSVVKEIQDWIYSPTVLYVGDNLSGKPLGDSFDSDVTKRLSMALAEAVECIDNRNPAGYNENLKDILDILRGKKTRSIPK